MFTFYVALPYDRVDIHFKRIVKPLYGDKFSDIKGTICSLFGYFINKYSMKIELITYS